MRCAIRHELEHIARGDWATQIASRLACAVYWPHPFVWALWSRLRLEAERACDDAVIRGATEPESYAEQLVSLARRLVGRGKVPALAMATRGNLGIRVEAILDRGLRRAPLSRYASMGVFAVAMAGLFVIAPFRLMSAAAPERQRPKYDDSVPRLLNQALLEASARGDLQQMHSLIERGADADARIPGDGTPLLAAARYGELDAMRTLIQNGADVNAGISGDGNAITAAAKSGSLEAVELLLDNGADIDRGVEGDGNALIMAAGEGHVDVIQLLLDRGADIEKVIPGDENPIIHASETGQIEAVKLLLSRGANVNARVWVERGEGGRVRGEWRTALKWAQRRGDQALIDVLVQAGARE
jgi:ankyrin repeat protein